MTELRIARKVEMHCLDREINLYATYRSNSEEWIINRVLAGVNVALMPQYARPEDAKAQISAIYPPPQSAARYMSFMCHTKGEKKGTKALYAFKSWFVSVSVPEEILENKFIAETWIINMKQI